MHQILTSTTLRILIKSVLKNHIFFGYWYYSCIRKPFTFSKEYFGKNIKLIIIIDDDIKHAKLQYSVRREAAKISALSSGKIDKHEYLIVIIL